MNEIIYKRGDQIRYIPNHATIDDNLRCEDGFVTSDLGKRGVMCRYWSKTFIGLRTKSCGELTPRRNLVLYLSTTKEEVEHAIVNYCDE